MALVKIRFLPTKIMASLYSNDPVRAVVEALESGPVEESQLFHVAGDSMDAAEEVFDLTNNPFRQDERELVYGRGRSLSVGDVVVVGDEEWVCLPTGWAEVKVAA
jgi:hypothetical protein